MTNEAPLPGAGAAPAAIRQGSKRCVQASRTRVVKKSSDQSAVELFQSFPSSALVPLNEIAAEVTAEWSGQGHPPLAPPQPQQGLGLQLVAEAWSAAEAQQRRSRGSAVSHSKPKPGSRPPERLGVTERDSERLRETQRDWERAARALVRSSRRRHGRCSRLPFKRPWCLDVVQTNVSACLAESSGPFVPMLLLFTETYRVEAVFLIRPIPTDHTLSSS